MAKVRKLYLQLRRQVDFDLAHQLNPVYTGVSLALVGTGIPTVLGTYVARWPDFADGEGSPSFRSRCGSLFRSGIAALQQSMADRLVLTAPAAANRLAPLGPIRVARSYLAHGIDAQHFSPGVREEDKSLSVLYFANMVKRKGIHDLIRAYAEVARSFPECTLLIAGSGPEAQPAQEAVERLGIASQVKFFGHVDRQRAPSIYRQASIYCLPSNGEPYATTVIEAMSCGKPVVYTNAGGLPHMVGAQGGIGVEVGDAQGLAQAICGLLADPARRRTMGEHNRRRVLDSMTWERVIDGLEEIYVATIAGTRRAPVPREQPAPLYAPYPKESA